MQNNATPPNFFCNCFRMKNTLAFALFSTLLTVVLCDDLTVENCHCNEGYEPKKKEDGTIECVGINVYTTEPCNTVNPPPCKCSGDVNSIVIDEKGTWCRSSAKEGNGTELWPCENKEDWIAYKTKTTNASS